LLKNEELTTEVNSNNNYDKKKPADLKLEGCISYDNFVNAIKSPETARTYVHCMRRYMEFMKVTNIDDLLLDSDKPVVIENKIIAFLMALRNNPEFNKVSFNTRQGYLYAVLAFYKYNDIELRQKRIARYLGTGAKFTNRDRGYTTEEIQRMLDHADIRGKALILLLCSSGIRVGAVPELRLRHFHKIEQYGIYRVTVYEGSNEEYYTYTTKEAADAIQAYIKHREDNGELVSEDSPFLRDRYAIHRINPEKLARHVQPLSNKGVSELIFYILQKCGILQERRAKRESLAMRNGTNGINGGSSCSGNEHQGSIRHDTKRVHAFRKFFNLALINANVKLPTKELLMGHQSNLQLDNSYFRPSEPEVLAEYLKAIDLLTINDVNRLQKEVSILKEKESEIELLKIEQRQKDKQLEEMKQAYKRDIQDLSKEMQAIRDMINNTSKDRQASSDKLIMMSKAFANQEARAKNIAVPFPEISESEGTQLLSTNG
jgi:integrase